MATFSELKQQIQLRLGDHVDGKTTLAMEQAINHAHMVIADVHDFDELQVLDVTNALTVAEQKSYHIEDDLNLERPKDIYSIRYMDEDNSRKLTYVSMRHLDATIPYTEMVGSGRPYWYTQRGRYIEFYRVPDEAKSLYIQHSQWPDILADDDDESPFLNIDHAIIALATDMTLAIIERTPVSSWSSRAQQLLGLGVLEEKIRPDRAFIAQPFDTNKSRGSTGEYWLNPFIKGNGNN